LILW
jgi:hypothetical protein